MIKSRRATQGEDKIYFLKTFHPFLYKYKDKFLNDIAYDRLVHGKIGCQDIQ